MKLFDVNTLICTLEEISRIQIRARGEFCFNLIMKNYRLMEAYEVFFISKNVLTVLEIPFPYKLIGTKTRDLKIGSNFGKL